MKDYKENKIKFDLNEQQTENFKEKQLEINLELNQLVRENQLKEQTIDKLKIELLNIKNFKYEKQQIRNNEKQWDLVQTQNKFYTPKGLNASENEKSLSKKLSKLEKQLQEIEWKILTESEYTLTLKHMHKQIVDKVYNLEHKVDNNKKLVNLAENQFLNFKRDLDLEYNSTQFCQFQMDGIIRQMLQLKQIYDQAIKCKKEKNEQSTQKLFKVLDEYNQTQD
ncbi:hypothetical protein PPERSA_03639 [Pseudocohnilembus persalinus]|uniref:Uncharacterized protein n=1 Tax=Pseudocohnilembus persalinus TaxID=266149 RepID=A0A0V0QE17_PSEPJ|nr:hypothetical protein PPERSA_03639 [Pseudocohnilembus persalinus]|eukprot:KRX00418.1 hypothetical protein PPERSA_03639 [Pseudocohnilembus persalinus]